jgi:23S rRNA pseudouridine1911/1915/1917 synthase
LEQGSSSNSGRRLEVTVTGDEGSSRLDRVLTAHLAELSRSRLKALILAGQVSVGNASIANVSMAKAAAIRDPAYHVGPGDTITIDVPEAAPAEPGAEDIALDIMYEDDDIVVIDKPAHLVVHPAAGHASGTLVNALIAHCGASLSGIGGVRRPGIVHRLDKDTTGLMVVAKNDRAHASLSAQFADHGRTGAMARGYLAFVWGVPNRQRGTVDAPIDRHPHAREKMAVRDGGREAVTHWEIKQTFGGNDGKPVASLLACRLETGRTHQIRVHLAHIGHPLMGDTVYGAHFKTKAGHLGPQGQAALTALGRQALHAYLLALEHPKTGEVLHWEAPLPEDLLLLESALEAAL